MKVFHINLSESGQYYLSAFALGYNTPSDEGNVYLTPIRIKIDGNPVGELDLQENGWQSARLKGDREIYLDSGHHSIEFLTPMP